MGGETIVVGVAPRFVYRASPWCFAWFVCAAHWCDRPLLVSMVVGPYVVVLSGRQQVCGPWIWLPVLFKALSFPETAAFVLSCAGPDRDSDNGCLCTFLSLCVCVYVRVRLLVCVLV